MAPITGQQRQPMSIKGMGIQMTVCKQVEIRSEHVSSRTEQQTYLSRRYLKVNALKGI